MYTFFKTILSEYTLGPSHSLHLCLDYELAFEVGAEFSTHDKCLFCRKRHSAQGYFDIVLVYELLCLVFMQHDVSFCNLHHAFFLVCFRDKFA